MNTKKALTVILTMALVLGVYGVAHAADTATQSVSFEVAEINEITVSGNPGTLVINAAAPGNDPAPATDSSTTYAITTNGNGKVITAAIDTPMPAGLTLKVKLDAQDVGASQGDVVLDATADPVVTGISKVAKKDLTITYTLSATAEAEAGSGSRTVTFTLTDAQ
ncbi:hypothetical protein [Acetomicrobium sp. UBA5826]|uniref:hypothetical protein n=1 Tax=Acetomicrobium sp. UBA5826 TaxID=1946039 RepID=UPI00257BA309|nr:hypothetical protein [Acetomicrobium sp. UBA5826]